VIERRFDLNGAQLDVIGDDDGLVTLIGRSLNGLETSEGRTPHYVITLLRHPPEAAPAGTPVIFDGPLMEGHHCVIHQVGAAEHWTVGDRISMLLEEDRARLAVPEDADIYARHTPSMRTVDMALTKGGQTMVHAAALALRGEEKAILLFGPSGRGKTTTTLSLLAGGFRLMADDSSVLKTDGGSLLVWGMPRALKVHRRTAELLPWLKPLLTDNWDKEDEQPLGPDRLAGLVTVLPPRPLPISALIAIGPRTGGDHRLAPLPKAEMLVRLAADNLGRTRAGIPADNLIRMERIAAAVAASPCFELNVGADLASLPDAILAALG
jgi:hypothetical protein